MYESLSLSVLPSCDECLPSVVCHDNSVIALIKKVFGSYLSFVDKRQHKTVSKVSPEFFHHIESKRSTPGTQCMEETNVWIKSNSFKSSCTVVRYQCVCQ